MRVIKGVWYCTCRVTAQNGVSDQDPDSVSDRSVTITGSTTEGGKGKIYILSLD